LNRTIRAVQVSVAKDTDSSAVQLHK